MILVNKEEKSVAEVIEMFGVPKPKGTTYFRWLDNKVRVDKQGNIHTPKKPIQNRFRVEYKDLGTVELIFATSGITTSKTRGGAQVQVPLDRSREMWNTLVKPVSEHEIEKYLCLYLNPRCVDSPARGKDTAEKSYEVYVAADKAKAKNKVRNLLATCLSTVQNMDEDEARQIAGAYEFSCIGKEVDEVKSYLFDKAVLDPEGFMNTLKDPMTISKGNIQRGVDDAHLTQKHSNGKDRWLLDGREICSFSNTDPMEKLRSHFLDNDEDYKALLKLLDGRSVNFEEKLEKMNDKTVEMVDNCLEAANLFWDRAKEAVCYETKKDGVVEFFKPEGKRWKTELIEHIRTNDDAAKQLRTLNLQAVKILKN
jgi:hypothetical protein